MMVKLLLKTSIFYYMNQKRKIYFPKKSELPILLAFLLFSLSSTALDSDLETDIENLNPFEPSYAIETAYNDVFFIINGNKYEAQTMCLNWQEGDMVKFAEGSPLGMCTTASLVNTDKNETCEVWCK